MGKGICKYAIPMKPPYQYPFACAVMYECRYEMARNRGGELCPRLEIGECMERNGLELKGARVVKRYSDLRKALEDPAVKEAIIDKHSSMGKAEEFLDMLGAITEVSENG